MNDWNLHFPDTAILQGKDNAIANTIQIRAMTDEDEVLDLAEF